MPAMSNGTGGPAAKCPGRRQLGASMTTITGTKTYASQWIGGDWCPSDAEAGIDVIDPSNETTLAVVPAGTPTDAQRAVAAASSAARSWSRTPLKERIRFLGRLADRLTAR